MANRKIETLPIDVELIKQRMKERKISIHKLANALDRNEKTIDRYFKAGAMPPFVRLDAFDILDIDVKAHDEQFKTDDLDFIQQTLKEMLNKIGRNIEKALEKAVSEISNDLESTDLTKAQKQNVMSIISKHIA